MISFRKVLFTLLAPLGAATIIGTGFATWVFGIQNVRVDTSFNNNVAVTPEVENGDIKILTSPNLIVFSEGTQGASNLSDGINFYTNKVVAQGKEFTITMDGNNSSHRLSLVYDNTTTVKKMYFSWKESESSNTINAGELSTFKPSPATDDREYIGTWSGSFGQENAMTNVELVLKSDLNLNGRITFKNEGGDTLNQSSFTFYERESTPYPDITVTDSTFSFRYTYDDPALINESNTRYHLNVKMKLALESSNYPFEFIDGGT